VLLVLLVLFGESPPPINIFFSFRPDHQQTQSDDSAQLTAMPARNDATSIVCFGTVLDYVSPLRFLVRVK